MKVIVEPQIANPEKMTIIMLNQPKKNPKVSNGTQPRNELTLHMFHGDDWTTIRLFRRNAKNKFHDKLALKLLKFIEKESDFTGELEQNRK